MPKYDFACRNCEKHWEEWLKMKDCEKPERRPCPHCKKKKVVYRSYTGKAPAMKMDSNFKIDSPHNQGGWQDAVRRMVSAPEVKYTPAAKILRDKYLR
jgi:putative FmdB family regulatory protein